MRLPGGTHEILLPGHFDSSHVDEGRRIPYEQRGPREEIGGAASLDHDGRRLVRLLAADLQNTFRILGDEVSVAGRAGRSAVDDNRSLIEFIYRNLGTTSKVIRA